MISIQHISKSYGGRVLFKDASLRIGMEDRVAIVGPNGAGKTTALKVLSGLLYPTAGFVQVLGFDPWDKKPEFLKKIALVMGQKNQLWWDLPAMDSFILNKEIYEVPDQQFKATVDELAELLEIKDILDVQVRKLSLGQRMKCELVAALLHKPKVLFLDEPTIGLDVVAQKNIRDFIKQYNQKNKTTIILTSHYMEDVKELCKRVIIIEEGKIGYDGDLARLIEKYAPYKVLKITFEGEGVKEVDIREFGEMHQFAPHSITLRVPREKAKNVARDILSSNLPVDDILIDEVDISDVVRKIFSNGN